MDFDLGLKDYEGNCDCCWKKSFRKLMTISIENPEYFNWWLEMEAKYGTSEEYTFFRENKSGLDIIEMAKNPFKRAVDEWELNKKSPKLFDSLDIGGYCDCGNF